MRWRSLLLAGLGLGPGQLAGVIVPQSTGLVVAASAACGLLLVLDHWRTAERGLFGRRWPQLVQEPARLEVDVALRADQMDAKDQGQWLHLTVKNRRLQDRRTRSASEAVLLSEFDGDTGQFKSSLRWRMENAAASPSRSIRGGERVYIPLLIHGDVVPGQSVWAPAYGAVMPRGETYVTDEQFYHGNAITLLPLGTVTNLWVTVEYDGGRRTRSAHFVVEVPKAPSEPPKVRRGDRFVRSW